MKIYEQKTISGFNANNVSFEDLRIKLELHFLTNSVNVPVVYTREKKEILVWSNARAVTYAGEWRRRA